MQHSMCPFIHSIYMCVCVFVCVRVCTSPSVEDADASVSPVVDLVPPQRGVAVRLDPHARHGVVEDLVVLDEAQARVVDQDAPVLAPPNLVALDLGVAARPGRGEMEGLGVSAL